MTGPILLVRDINGNTIGRFELVDEIGLPIELAAGAEPEIEYNGGDYVVVTLALAETEEGSQR